MTSILTLIDGSSADRVRLHATQLREKIAFRGASVFGEMQARRGATIEDTRGWRWFNGVEGGGGQK